MIAVFGAMDCLRVRSNGKNRNGFVLRSVVPKNPKSRGRFIFDIRLEDILLGGSTQFIIFVSL